MSKDYPVKAPLASIALFGAGGRISRHVVDYLRYKAPHIRLRLLASSEESRAGLQKMYPDGDIMVANYLDRASLGPALDGMEGVFVITPSGLDEQTAMDHFADAARQAGSARHIIRLVGYAPETTPDAMPARLLELGGDGDQHYTAKAILQASGLPVTYINLGASLMDNLLFTVGALQRSHTLIWPQRHVPLMDGRDLGEVIARVFLSDDARHIGSFHTVNNGYDYPTTKELAQIMSDVFMTPIGSDTSWESFSAEYGAMINARWGRDTEVEYRFKHFQYEHDHLLWCLNSFAETILGRRPNTFRSWLQEHRGLFLPDAG
ncbi:SDR family oxidoreductase [Novosphingobium beihaiensis]|uniref:NAD(P)H-binding protein n=1 Tax=Novosphingobium beihaiensis TaxID=2930389 RepID=A0ABT0BTY1_9SPHN|nr:NAD(P)H-binding protein [Novosphingobium beihaiensis]MCJ2188445.1 NAD(P)H-binding protein [Novosphingobium beihaiensis]